MQAGLLRHRIELRRNESSTQDAYGAPIPNWIAYATRWGQITPLSGRELEVARAMWPTVSHTLTLRCDPTQPVSPEHVAAFGNRTFAIQSVINVDERNRELKLAVTEIVAGE